MGFGVQKTLGSRRHEALVARIIEKRKAAGLTQEDLARALGEHQSFIARLESGQRRIDVIEYLTLAEAIGFNAADEIHYMMSQD
ncbi:helix-turn-helix domain-containing protein [Ferirhizobium litorale]|uniref:Helix-turn-helix transcriptional regulator n=1 Tax=Ferirhizobium litorale TaxID=2927786 RepID=A0AAE3QBS1_9HYPH|nr:helix-turn-helix transcriptional regulator [Fererhizobium litorale]MDI7920705.1 helix-turn-helix transcriptional regulator [Fererhizobium litorale]